jgi:hypothetical protein
MAKHRFFIRADRPGQEGVLFLRKAALDVGKGGEFATEWLAAGDLLRRSDR